MRPPCVARCAALPLDAPATLSPRCAHRPRSATRHPVPRCADRPRSVNLPLVANTAHCSPPTKRHPWWRRLARRAVARRAEKFFGVATPPFILSHTPHPTHSTQSFLFTDNPTHRRRFAASPQPTTPFPTQPTPPYPHPGTLHREGCAPIRALARKKFFEAPPTSQLMI